MMRNLHNQFAERRKFGYVFLACTEKGLPLSFLRFRCHSEFVDADCHSFSASFFRRSYMIFDQNVFAHFYRATKYLEQSQFH